MHTLANQHYLSEIDERRDDMPAHWSSPAQRYQESLIRLNETMTQAIEKAPSPFREIMAAMHAEILQLRRMVSEGVILAMVRDEFWKQYSQVPVQVDDFVNISEATIALYDELFDQGWLKADAAVRAKINDAVTRRLEARRKVA